MRLALATEDVEAGLADASDRALRRIPAASAEVNVLQVCGTAQPSAAAGSHEQAAETPSGVRSHVASPQHTVQAVA
jgi:hypothetical protein